MAFLHSQDSGCAHWFGRFSGGTSPAVQAGKKFSVAYSGTGVYTVTLAGGLQGYASVVTAKAWVASPDLPAGADASDHFFLIWDSNASTLTNTSTVLVFRAYVLDAAAAPAAAAVASGDSICFEAILGLSTLVA